MIGKCRDCRWYATFGDETACVLLSDEDSVGEYLDLFPESLPIDECWLAPDVRASALFKGKAIIPFGLFQPQPMFGCLNWEKRRIPAPITPEDKERMTPTVSPA